MPDRTSELMISSLSQRRQSRLPVQPRTEPWSMGSDRRQSPFARPTSAGPDGQQWAHPTPYATSWARQAPGSRHPGRHLGRMINGRRRPERTRAMVLGPERRARGGLLHEERAPTAYTPALGRDPAEDRQDKRLGRHGPQPTNAKIVDQKSHGHGGREISDATANRQRTWSSGAQRSWPAGSPQSRGGPWIRCRASPRTKPPFRTTSWRGCGGCRTTGPAPQLGAAGGARQGALRAVR